MTYQSRINSAYNPSLGKLIYPHFNKFCEWFNGTNNVTKENGYSDAAVKTKGVVLNTAKVFWPLHIVAQLFGLVFEPFNKLAKGIYGTCWPVVYSAYRPFAANKRTLEGTEASGTVKKLFNVNEHLRVWAGSVVSGFYSLGGAGMLWGTLSGNEGLFEKASSFYQEWMKNQNLIFGVMNCNNMWLRKYNPTQVEEVHHDKNTLRSHVELFDSLTIIPNLLTRSLATFRSFGGELSEGVGRAVDVLGNLNYATWTYRFGDLKGREEEGGDLKPVDKTLQGNGKVLDQALYDTQKFGSKMFKFLLAPVTLASAVLKGFGLDELSDKLWTLEGTLERLQTAIGSWSIRSTWLEWFGNNGEVQPVSSQQEQTQQIGEDGQAATEKAVGAIGVNSANGNGSTVLLPNRLKSLFEH